MTKKSLVSIDAIRQGLQEIFPQVKENLVNLFESLLHVLANTEKITQISRT